MAETLLVSSGKAGAVLTVTAPAGAVVIVSKGGKTYRKTSDGTAVFRGLASGLWNVEITDGSGHSVSRQMELTVDYAVSMVFFAAYIHVTWPVGSYCQVWNDADWEGTHEFADPEAMAAGEHTFTVTSTGVYMIECFENEEKTKRDLKYIEIKAEGQEASVSLAY